MVSFEKTDAILSELLKVNGDDYQEEIAREEIAELIAELGKCITTLSQMLAGINHVKRCKIALGDLCGEIADVDLTINYLKLITDPELIENIKQKKIAKLREMVDNGQNQNLQP